MKKITSNIIKVGISLAISAVILYFVYRDYDFSEFWSGIAEMRLGWLWLALLCSAIGPLLRGLRWNLLLDPIGCKVLVRDSILTVFTGYAANIIVPRIGEICRCAILDRNNKVPFSKSFGTLVAERFVDFIFLLLLTVITVVTQRKMFIDLFAGKAGIYGSTAVTETAETPADPHIWLWIAAAVLVAIFCIVRIRFRLWERILGFIKGFWAGFVSLRQIDRLPLFLAYSTGIWICYYLEMYAAFFCIDSIAGVGPIAGLVCFVAGSIAVLVPTPNGAGPWHFAVTSMLVLYGIGQTDAQTFALVLHTAQTATYLLCGAIAWIALHFVKRT